LGNDSTENLTCTDIFYDVRTQLRCAAAMELEDAGAAMMFRGTRVLLSGNIVSAAELDESISKVTAQDVQTVSGKVKLSKVSRKGHI